MLLVGSNLFYRFWFLVAETRIVVEHLGVVIGVTSPNEGHAVWWSNKCATRSALWRAFPVFAAEPSSKTIAAHSVMIHQIGCVASVK